MSRLALLPHSLLRVFFITTAFTLSPLRAQHIELTDIKAKPVAVESASVKTEVSGRIAVTTFDMVFRNPNSRILEGNFVFPLLEGQSVTRFALDINGALREAVPVDKTRGRIVFEDIERRGIDPGLIEQVGGNNYRARVYPIPANGTRRVVITYQEDLGPTNDSPATYRLNLNFPGKLKAFHLAIRTLATNGSPAKVRTTLPLELPAWRDGKSLEIERADFPARGLLELKLPPLDRPSVITGYADNIEYFYADLPVTASALPRPVPQKIGLLWDSSGSGRARDHRREFALLDAWFSIVKNVEVHLVRIRDIADPPKVIVIRNGNWSTLKKELSTTIYDGATSLDGVANDPSVQEWLLFSDGHINYGTSSPATQLPFTSVVHSVLSTPGADASWLKTVARRHDGEFVNLLAITPSAAASRLRSSSPRITNLIFDPKAIAQIFPEIGTPVSESRVIVTGILRQPTAQINLAIGHQANGSIQSNILTLHSGENSDSLAPRAWATTKIRHLSLDPVANREDIRRTSRSFGIVTADTSLVVLETVADYLRYEIPPPSELRDEWESQRQSESLTTQENNTLHLESVITAFQDAVMWWEKDFPKDTPPTNTDKQAISPVRPTPNATVLGQSNGGRAASDEETVELTPFEVRSESDPGYFAASTAQRLSLEFNDDAGQARDSATVITLQAWSPQAGYLDHLRRTPTERCYAVYLEERPEYERQPGFFLDVADYLLKIGDTDHGLRVLSNLAELELEDVSMIRVLAHRLSQLDRPALAKPLWERVLALRPDEPQSYRDLALVCASLQQYQRAVNLLADIVTKSWDARFPEIELIALRELNAIVATCHETLDLSRIDPRLLKNLPVSTRAILTWDANDCDIDLWVTDPNGEVAMYSNPLTYQGGHMSRDFTDGYGPEEFMLRDPKPGVYHVQINYYGDRRQTALGPVTAQLRLITDFGTAQQTEKRLTVRLEDNKETLEIGSFEVTGKN